MQLPAPLLKSSDFNADSYVTGPADYDGIIRISYGVMLGSEPDTAFHISNAVSDVSAVTLPLYAIGDGESNAV